MDFETMLNDTIYGAPRQTRRARVEYVNVDAILVSRTDLHYTIKLDEDSKPMRISSYGIKLVRGEGDYVILRLSEARAIGNNLI